MNDGATTSRCPGCGRGIDPLRAGTVAILAGEFRYFCDQSCKVTHLRALTEDSAFPDDVATAEPPAVASDAEPRVALDEPVVTARSRTSATPPLEPKVPSAPDVIVANQRNAKTEPPSARVRDVAEPTRAAMFVPSARATWIGALGIASGSLASLLALFTHSLAPRAVVAAIAAIAFVSARPQRPWFAFAPVLLAALGATLAAIAHVPRAPSYASLVGAIAAASLIVEAMVARARASLMKERAALLAELEVRVLVARGDATEMRSVREVKSGEQVVLAAGDVCGVDGIVARGEAVVTPWPGAPVDLAKKEGDPIVAGARVVYGSMRVATTWAGDERAWAKLFTSPAHAFALAAPHARFASRLLVRGTPVVALVVSVATYFNGGGSAEILASAAAALIAACVGGALDAIDVPVAASQLAALRHGIVFRDGAAFERASRVDVAVLCARGTVLMGEPEIVAVEPLAPTLSAPALLACAAGVEAASTHPFAAAIRRAAHAHGERIESVRNAVVHAGLGVSALSANGERVVVGSRAFLLQERVSVAVVDARVSELESLGRSVLLVALTEKVIGLIALQDGLRAGARGAVGRLYDARIEPVLLSGEARETCETIARALEIDHVRPEVLPVSRGAEVRALGEGGHITAAIGHPANDDGALGAADVSVAMGAAGATPGEWAIALASDDVRDAAFALSLARATRERVRTSLIFALTPAAIALVAILFGVAPLLIGPAAAIIGAISMRAVQERVRT